MTSRPTFIPSTTVAPRIRGSTFLCSGKERLIHVFVSSVHRRVHSTTIFCSTVTSGGLAPSDPLQSDSPGAEDTVIQGIPVVSETEENPFSAGVSIEPPKESTTTNSVDKGFFVQNASSGTSDLSGIEPNTESELVGVPDLFSETQPANGLGTLPEDFDGDLNAGPNRDGARRRRRRFQSKEEIKYKLEDLTVGTELEGVVRSVTSYGAFIKNMGTGTDGLLHVSHLSSNYVENVRDIVSEGDKVTVRVLNVDVDKGTISLTMKTREELESAKDGKRNNTRVSASARQEEQKRKWDNFVYDSTEYVNAKVISLTDFGAFCRLINESGEPLESAPTDGLIHISELSIDRVEKVSDVLNVDDIVKVRIISTDPKRNHLSLSLKPVHASPSTEETDEDTKTDRKINKRNERKKSRNIDHDETVDVAAEMKKAEVTQPDFRTSFELAFERARARVAAKN